MKNLIAVRTIKEVLGYEFNKTGRDVRVGCTTKLLDGDKVHAVQVIQPNGVRSNKFFSQELHSDGTIHSVVTNPGQLNGRADDLLDNDYLHGVEFDVFIGSDVPVTVEKSRRVRFGKGFTVKKVKVESIEKGYWYGKYRVIDTWVDLKTGHTHYIQKPVSLTA